MYMQEENPLQESIVFEWSFYDPEPIVRNNKWYLLFGLVLGFLMLSAAFTQNWLFLMILFIVGALIVARAVMPSNKVFVAITRTGLLIDNSLRLYDVIESFWVVIHDQENATLYFDTVGFVDPQIVVPCHSEDVSQIRRILSRYLPEDIDKEEGLADAIIRFLKI